MQRDDLLSFCCPLVDYEETTDGLQRERKNRKINMVKILMKVGTLCLQLLHKVSRFCHQKPVNQNKQRNFN